MRPVLFILLIFALLALPAAAVYWLVVQPLIVPARAEPAPVDAAKLQAHVRALSERFYPRSIDHLEKLDLAAAYIKSEFGGSGGKTSEQVFEVDGVEYRNIICQYGPAQGPVLVIGAHYDSVATLFSTSVQDYGPDTHTPGADDNASGVAGLLELARLLGKTPPSINIELVAYTLEEPPHFRTEAMGSVRHSRALREAGREVKLMLALEMIGYFTDSPGSQTYPLPILGRIYPDRGDFIAVVGRLQDWASTRRLKRAMLGASDLPVHSINAMPSIPGVDLSDHSSYWNEGYTALMITDTAFYRNPHYHRGGDRADTLDYTRMAKVVQGIYAYIRSQD